MPMQLMHRYQMSLQQPLPGWQKRGETKTRNDGDTRHNPDRADAALTELRRAQLSVTVGAGRPPGHRPISPPWRPQHRFLRTPGT